MKLLAFASTLLLLSMNGPAWGAEVAPFGFAVGGATLDQVRTGLSAKTKVEHHGINKWTQGPMLRANGSGLGVEGLQSVVFIFDKNSRLVGVILDLPKPRYDDIRSYLKGKYTVLDEQAPFVGDRSVKLREGAVTIEASARHLSFQMEVSYTHDDLMKKFNVGSQVEQQQKHKSEESQF